MPNFLAQFSLGPIACSREKVIASPRWYRGRHIHLSLGGCRPHLPHIRQPNHLRSGQRFQNSPSQRQTHGSRHSGFTNGGDATDCIFWTRFASPKKGIVSTCVRCRWTSLRGPRCGARASFRLVDCMDSYQRSDASLRQSLWNVSGLTNRSSQPLAVPMSSFHMTSTLNSAAKLAPVSGG